MENLLSAANHGLAQANAVVTRPGTPRPGVHARPAAAAPSATAGPSCGQVLLGLPAIPTVRPTEEGASPHKRPRKQRAENWSEREVLVLVEAKRILTDEEEGAPDGRAVMAPDSTKWQRISVDLALAAVSVCPRDGSACKSKWNLIIQEYKRIVDFHSRTGTNEQSYWSLSTSERKMESLPRTFHEAVFSHLHSWYGRRPSVKPPHSRDLLSVGDSNYRTPASTMQRGEHDSSPEDDHDPLSAPFPTTDSEDFTGSTQSPARKASKFRQSSFSTDPFSPVQVTAAAPAKGSLPAGVSPILLSSSDTTDGIDKRRARNTGVRRKTLTGHALIAEATKTSGDAMMEQLKNMNEASCEAERNKINLQLKFFTEQMDYQLWRDERLQDNARSVNENAKMAIQKQSELILCLSQLSTVLSAGLSGRSQNASYSDDGQFRPTNNGKGNQEDA